jgi:flavodoxin
MPKILVVYYSRTGATKNVAEHIAKALKCDIEQVLDRKDRSGAWGYMAAGRDAMKKKLTGISSTKKNPAGYDLVVVGTPVWAWTVCPAVRTYLEKNKNSLDKVAFFCTMAGSGAEKAFAEMESVCAKKPVVTLSLLTKEVVGNQHLGKVKGFVRNLR